MLVKIGKKAIKNNNAQQLQRGPSQSRDLVLRLKKCATYYCLFIYLCVFLIIIS